MTAPLIQGASGIEGEKLTYASTNENNKEIYTFTANEPVTWSIKWGRELPFFYWARYWKIKDYFLK